MTNPGIDHHHLKNLVRQKREDVVEQKQVHAMSD